MTNQPAILYVEDDISSRKVIRILLSRLMQLPHVTIFEDSQDFLARAEALDPKPDMIFLDIHVHPHSGFEMLKMLRQSPIFFDTPVIALTASVMNEEIEQLRTAGFNSCLSKPIDMEIFPDLLNRLVTGEEIWHIAS